MRGRFSSADLLNYLGWLDDAFTDQVFAEYRRLTGAAGQVHGLRG
jgi:hypothetical protein